MRPNLSTFDNSWYQAGRSTMTQALWFFLGLPVLRSSVIPSSRIRVFLLRIFGARIGDGVVLKPGIRVKYPWLLSLGDRSWIGEDVWIDNLANVTIGSDVCISQGAYFCTGNHDWSDGAFGLIVKPIVLENGSWVGARSMICPGVTVHECGIAAAGSVVSKDVPAFEIHAGNPATLVRIREFRSTGKRPAAPRTVTSGVS
jgi:putative colanic acid biosynthesis acetyltransferase WcaF